MPPADRGPRLLINAPKRPSAGRRRPTNESVVILVQRAEDLLRGRKGRRAGRRARERARAPARPRPGASGSGARPRRIPAHAEVRARVPGLMQCAARLAGAGGHGKHGRQALQVEPVLLGAQLAQLAAHGAPGIGGAAGSGGAAAQQRDGAGGGA
jgi:hypothetical protein